MRIPISVYIATGSKNLSVNFSCEMTCVPRVGDQVLFDGEQYLVREVIWLLPTAAGEEVRLVVRRCASRRAKSV